MRIVVVSAHYPPNFVSGGTLQPQRLARGLLALGHDVQVFAGYLDPERAALETWDDVDETGLPVRWVVTTPWTGWDQTLNFENPGVADTFGRFVDEFGPDVVHFHALQSMGASLLPVAAARGAAVVVTMHDFWWFCARQFLADRDLRPCSLVVDAGVCPCQVDRAFLDARTARLRRFLQHADVILAPSESARRVLVANGVEPERVDVDANGLPELPLQRQAISPGHGPVHFTYVGGAAEEKGVRVLFDAVERMQSPAPWTLRAYGALPWLTKSGRHAGRSNVEALDPFLPDEADAVWAATDVLVLPSTVRESFSLATREALARGIPVVCTATLGPEEVVTHDVNGLVVSSGEPELLAEAMDRLVDDRDLLERLRTGAAQPIELRSLREQVEGVEGHLRAAVEQRAGRRPGAGGRWRARLRGRPSVARTLFVTGIDGAPLRYRVHLPAEGLARLGVRSAVRHYLDPALARAARRADAVVLYRVPATERVLALVARARSDGVPVLFDVDDLIFDPDVEHDTPALGRLSPTERALWVDGVRRYRTTMEACDVYVASTEPLARAASELVGIPVERFDNGVGVELGRLSDAAVRRARTPGPLRIGYFSGTKTHDDDWFFVEPAVIAVLQRHQDVELWLGGLLPTSPAIEALGGRVRRISLLPWTELPDLLRDVDVNLSPLRPGNRFNEAKSAIKWLESALVGTPTVATPTEPMTDATDDGVTALLASTVDEWAEAIDRLVRDPLLRGRVGSAAQREALLRWSPHVQGRRYLDLLERARRSVAVGVTGPYRTTEAQVAPDEPATIVTLEPYGTVPTRWQGAATSWRTAAARTRVAGRDVRQRLSASVRADGVTGTARRVVRRAAREAATTARRASSQRRHRSSG